MFVGTQGLLDTLETACAPPLPDESKFYGWQPLPLLDFYREGMDIVGPGISRSFLDIGSGIGSKLYLADALGWKVYGIELLPKYAEVSQILFPGFPVTVVDAFTYDSYGEYDMVYCYRPCVDPTDQDKLNRVIVEQLRPGALFFSAGGPWPHWLEHVGGQVWRMPS